MGSLVYCVRHQYFFPLSPSSNRHFQLTFVYQLSIARHPALTFVVVVNPASGPGLGDGPDANYTREIPKLNSYANVRTMGYVSTDWTKRDIALAKKDIATYSAWAQNASVQDLGVQGIFLDETPAVYNDASAQYLDTLASAIRSANGFGSDPVVSNVERLFVWWSGPIFPIRAVYLGYLKQQAICPFQSGTRRLQPLPT